MDLDSKSVCWFDPVRSFHDVLSLKEEHISTQRRLLLSSTNPCRSRNPDCTAGTSSQSDETGAPPNSSTGSTSTYGPLRLTFPLDATLLASDETEPDSLPFALDRESSLVSPSPAALHGGGAPAGGSETEPTSLGRTHLHSSPTITHTNTHTHTFELRGDMRWMSISPCRLPCL